MRTLAAVAALAALCAPLLRAAPPAGMDFDRYVFAAAWQPGICASHDPLSPDACARRSPRAPMSRQWTLHGLWADLPANLKREGLTTGQWYEYGCYWFRPGHAEPKTMCDDAPVALSPRVRKALAAQMPGTLGCLERHEYNKHAACYGFAPDAFFTRALGLLKKLNASSFTAAVRARRGRVVPRAELERAFATAFRLRDASALELRCGKRPGATKADVLVQAWITLRRDGVDAFPAPESFLAGRRGNCADDVLVAR